MVNLSSFISGELGWWERGIIREINDWEWSRRWMNSCGSWSLSSQLTSSSWSPRLQNGLGFGFLQVHRNADADSYMMSSIYALLACLQTDRYSYFMSTCSTTAKGPVWWYILYKWDTNQHLIPAWAKPPQSLPFSNILNLRAAVWLSTFAFFNFYKDYCLTVPWVIGLSVDSTGRRPSSAQQGRERSQRCVQKVAVESCVLQRRRRGARSLCQC